METNEMERKIARQIIDDGIAAGYTIDVYDGEETVLKRSIDPEAIIAAMFSTDSDMLIFHEGDRRKGSVWFVYGNTGWDVVADYSTSLEPIMTGADKLSDEYQEQLYAKAR
ncbi:hypothetical protein NK6_8735 [Bradyrhizobium diazoefficiens]|uniref:Uncharacterized protein n=1 Tax=Bradyrhizobium diazoefficiens TaxID=1355477 RepID=A0A0E4BWQ3_9BRAD|nr:hypothetical protein NK6_8735 [Bradyrhizobium diazoefficiens]